MNQQVMIVITSVTPSQAQNVAINVDQDVNFNLLNNKSGNEYSYSRDKVDVMIEYVQSNSTLIATISDKPFYCTMDEIENRIRSYIN